MPTLNTSNAIKSLNKSHLVMCIVIEGPDLKEVNFNHICKDQNHHIVHYYWNPGVPLSLYETL